MSKQNPPWFAETRDFCKTAGIKIMGWGTDGITVEAKSPERRSQIAAQLGQLGFCAVENEDDAYAGVLDLSKDPQALQSQLNSFDISHRRGFERIEPLFFAMGLLLLVPGLNSDPRETWWLAPLLGLVCLPLFFWDAARVWGWRLDLLPASLRVRRYFRWTEIPWNQISKIESNTAKFGRGQEIVSLTLTSHSSIVLGAFWFAFARNLRDRLRYELAQRRK